MGEHTEISWTEATFNTHWGCTRVSDECTNCYAETLAKRFNVKWGKNADRRFFGDKHWQEPLRWNDKAAKRGVPMRVFCASMADVFEDRRDLDEVRHRLWVLIESTPWLVWLLLTKRPENVMGGLGGQGAMVPHHWRQGIWPANVWLGTTAGHQKSADERVPHLVNIPAPVRFLSCEPMLGPINLLPWLDFTMHDRPLIDWVICGGESGTGARPMHPEWARSLRDQADAAGVPFLFKQWGEWSPEANDASLLGQEARLARLGKKDTDGNIRRTLDGRTHDGVPAIALPGDMLL